MKNNHRTPLFHEYSDLSLSRAVRVNFPMTCRAWAGAFAFSITYASAAFSSYAIVALFVEKLYTFEFPEWAFLAYFVFIYSTFVIWLDKYLLKRYGMVQYMWAQYRLKSKLCGPTSHPAGQALIALARIHEDRQEYDQACAIYHRLVGTTGDQQQSLPLEAYDDRATLYRRIGLLHCYMTNPPRYEEALEAFQTALELRQQSKRPFPYQIQKDFHAVGQIEEQLGNFECAAMAYQSAAELLEEKGLGETWDAAKSHLLAASLFLSDGYSWPGRATEALQLALHVYALNEGDLSKRACVARAHEQLGDALLLQNKQQTKNQEQPLEEQLELSDGAKKEYQTAVEIYRRAGRSDTDKQISTLLQKMDEMSFSMV